VVHQAEVAVDKVVAVKEAAVVAVGHRAAVDKVVAVREEAVVAASPAVAAEEAVNSSHSSGASRCCDAPFFY
ncbi:MAG: hypothetical protein M3P00_01055, partial [Gemmatimonadota bacterium]|nr:hypothetical protein [Gemmatimonadota bacterium]